MAPRDPKSPDRPTGPQGARPKPTGPRPALAPPEPQAPVPAVLAQTSRRHKVMAAVNGDDEFSVFSMSASSREKEPVDMNPDAKPKPQAEGGGKLLRFFKGFFGG